MANVCKRKGAIAGNNSGACRRFEDWDRTTNVGDIHERKVSRFASLGTRLRSCRVAGHHPGACQARRCAARPTPCPSMSPKSDIATGSLVTEENIKLEQWPKDRVPAGAVISPGRHRWPPRTTEDLCRRADHRAQTPRPRPGAHRQPGSQGAPRGCRSRSDPRPSTAGWCFPDRVATCRSSFAPIRPWESAKPSARPSCRTSAYLPSTTSRAPSPRSQGPGYEIDSHGQDRFLLVTPAQAQIVTLASQLGSIRLILRSGDDSEAAENRGHDRPRTVGRLRRRRSSEGEPGRGRMRSDSGSGPKRFEENDAGERQGRPRQSPPARTATLHNAGPHGGRSQRRPVDQQLRRPRPAGDEGAWTATGMGPSCTARAGHPRQTGRMVGRRQRPPIGLHAQDPDQHSADSQWPGKREIA